MRTNCAPLVADLFLFCYERDFMISRSDDKQADVIKLHLTLNQDIWTIFYTLIVFILIIRGVIQKYAEKGLYNIC